ncbi:hypothetical protein BMS3Abin07_02242 [bacterium BMS3Abin07]|nr:hypothetical protein BMS3Abin07_02242 [bacterium BMS3Abin07]
MSKRKDVDIIQDIKECVCSRTCSRSELSLIQLIAVRPEKAAHQIAGAKLRITRLEFIRPHYTKFAQLVTSHQHETAFRGLNPT